MRRRAADILKDALALSVEARAALASQLRDSLDPHAELHRRHFVRARRRALVYRFRTADDLLGNVSEGLHQALEILPRVADRSEKPPSPL